MKRSTLVLATIAGLVAVADAAAPKGNTPLTPEQRDMIIMMKAGGFIDKPIQTTVVRIYNTQDAVERKFIEEVAVQMERGPHFPVEIVERPWASAPQKEAGVGVAISIVNDPAASTKILCAPDDGWAKVNVAPLLADKPDADRLVKRVKKEIWRALCYTLGAGNTQNPICVLKPVASLEDIDNLSCVTSEPNSLIPIMDWGKRWGINEKVRTTYYRACMEGWAPAPTNKYQQAIWDKIHAMPDNPLRIKFDPKKGK